MDLNFLMSLLVCVLLVGGITVFVKVLNDNKKIKDIVNIVTEFLPNLVDTVMDVITVSKPETATTLEKAADVVKKAVHAVEQISLSENMTSEEKKELAMEYYFQIAKDFGMPELNELQVQTLEILIENAVIEMNKIVDKLDEKKEQAKLPE